jgi:hypothetical protein
MVHKRITDGLKMNDATFQLLPPRCIRWVVYCCCKVFEGMKCNRDRFGQEKCSQMAAAMPSMISGEIYTKRFTPACIALTPPTSSRILRNTSKRLLHTGTVTLEPVISHRNFCSLQRLSIVSFRGLVP